MEILKQQKYMILWGKSSSSCSFYNFGNFICCITFTKGLNFGIDFAGGTVIQVKYEKEAPISQIRDILKIQNTQMLLSQNLEVMKK